MFVTMGFTPLALEKTLAFDTYRLSSSHDLPVGIWRGTGTTVLHAPPPVIILAAPGAEHDDQNESHGCYTEERMSRPMPHGVPGTGNDGASQGSGWYRQSMLCERYYLTSCYWRWTAEETRRATIVSLSLRVRICYVVLCAKSMQLVNRSTQRDFSIVPFAYPRSARDLGGEYVQYRRPQFLKSF